VNANSVKHRSGLQWVHLQLPGISHTRQAWQIKPHPNQIPVTPVPSFTAKTADKIRWLTQLSGLMLSMPIVAVKLSYISAPLTKPTTITGAPIVTTHLSTTATDVMIIRYLEAVAPDGCVSYITEGLLRLTNRKETSDGPPYVALVVNCSFKRADALLAVLGEIMKIRLQLLATSVQIRAGYRVRIALAGAADGAFDRLPKTGTAKWTIYRAAQRL
jgi:uncharacterized protein